MGKKKVIMIVAAAVALLGLAVAAIWFVLFRPDPAEADSGNQSQLAASGTVDGQPDGGQTADGAPAGNMGAPGTEETEQETGSDVPDIPLDAAIYGNGTEESDEDGEVVDLPGGYDGTVDDGEEEDGSDDDDSGDPVSGVGNQTDGYEAGAGEDGGDGNGNQSGTGGFQAPVVEDTGRQPSSGGSNGDDVATQAGGTGQDGTQIGGQTGTQTGGQTGTQTGTQDNGQAGTQAGTQAGNQRVNGVPATFVKAVYSRNKTKALVLVSLPAGKTVTDPSKYMVISNKDANGHTPGKAVIYSCPSQSSLVIYMSSSHYFGENAAFAIVPMGVTGTADVYEDCYVELPYGATYQGSSILDGSQADFSLMMRLMFDDMTTVNTWVNTRSTHVLGSVGSLGGKLSGTSQLQLDSVASAPAVDTGSQSGGQQAGQTAQPSDNNQTGQQLGPDGSGTSAADPAPASGQRKQYVLDKGNKIYHDASCASLEGMPADNREDRMCLKSELESEGYTPCSQCRPS